MAKLDRYEDTLVIQREPQTGCIPSGIEWMARYVDVADVDFDSFQEDFDLAAQGKGGNGFKTVPVAVAVTYPQIATSRIEFPEASAKIACILDCVTRGTPCLVSLLQEDGRFHIVPVVEADEESITVLSMDGATVEEQLQVLDHEEIRRRHDAVAGGRDVLIWGDPPEDAE